MQKSTIIHTLNELPSKFNLDDFLEKLIVIEKDQRCLEALKELQEFYENSLEIIEGDALEIDEEKLFASEGKIKIIANLPYNIGTVLLFKWLRISHKISSIFRLIITFLLNFLCFNIQDYVFPKIYFSK